MSESNRYPQIFSLSTANIRHHGSQDYIFHPLRTDFIGDSGVGKSMIADMLQLVFVGRREFKPSTDGESRTPKGMVLYTKGRGFGYIFLNIRMDEQAYVVIGVYININSNQLRHFIVHAGYDQNSLQPFSTPVSYKSVIVDNSILPIDNFVDRMESLEGTNRRIVHPIPQIKTYHKILFKNEILPIDFSKSQKNLKDYSNILNSFARGSAVKSFQKDTDKLKAFLFGNQDADELWKNFNQEEQTWADSLENYEQNKNEINRVRKIGLRIGELEKIDANRKLAEETYLFAQANYYYNRYARIEKEITQLANNLSAAEWEKRLIDGRKSELELIQCKQKLAEYEQNRQAFAKLKATLEKEKKTYSSLANQLSLAGVELDSAHESLKLVQQVEHWLTSYNNSLEDLQIHFSQQQTNKVEAQSLHDFTEYLKANNLLDTFIDFMWAEDYELARQKTVEEFVHLDKQIRILESLRTFSDLENPDSLARWALDQGKSLSQIQESILLHFQDLPIYEPPSRKKPARYLPNPAKLFEDDIEMIEADDDGFWLNLGGILEFVELRPHLLVNLQIEEQKDVLNNLFNETDAKYKTYTAKREKLQRLQEFLGYGENQENIELFKKRQEIKDFPVDPALPEQISEFEHYISAFSKAATIKETYRTALDLYQAIKKRKQESDARIRDLEIQSGVLLNKLGSKNFQTLKQTKKNKQEENIRIKQELKKIDPAIVDTSTAHSILRNENVADLINMQFDLVKSITRSQTELESKRKECEKIKEDVQLAIHDYQSKLAKPFSANPQKASLSFSSEKEEFDRLERKFDIDYQSVASTYAENDLHRFKGSSDIGLLVYVLLPNIFSSPDIANTGIMTEITTHLESINEKNRAINKKRIDFFLEIFDKVRDHHHSQREILNRLRNFFQSEEAKITGGYKVVLTNREVYSPDWIANLRDALSDWNRQQTNTSLNENSAVPNVTVDEVVVKTFKEFTGRIQIPKLKDLLDAKTYFELSFELKNASGVTEGSTGQAYTGLALLCLARLSLIEKDVNRRGIRFMPIDEAEGIGSNYETLRKLAEEYDYQIVTMSIRVLDMKPNEQNLYILRPNPNESEGVNYPPYPKIGFGKEQVALWKQENA